MSLTWFGSPVLGIETSCDETSVAVVRDSHVLSNVVSSQIDLHRRWGGVVPEAASRAHVEAILPMLQQGLSESGLEMGAIGAVAVTNRPGLVGALSVGVSAAKAISVAQGIPLIGVHHLEGHLLSVLADEASVEFPHISLIVSGGHTEVVLVRAPGDYDILAATLDDAAGEAFDKSARLLGLGNPGGYHIQELARSGNPKRYSLPIGVKDDLRHFSFSGLKTAVMRMVQSEGEGLSSADMAASIQHAIVEALIPKVLAAVLSTSCRAVSVVGGVSANVRLRERLREECDREGIALYCPAPAMSTDNAAMIALAGSLKLGAGARSGFDLDVYSGCLLV